MGLWGREILSYLAGILSPRLHEARNSCEAGEHGSQAVMISSLSMPGMLAPFADAGPDPRRSSIRDCLIGQRQKIFAASLVSGAFSCVCTTVLARLPGSTRSEKV